MFGKVLLTLAMLFSVGRALGADCRTEVPGIGKITGLGGTALEARENASLTCGLKLQSQLGHSLTEDEKDGIIDTCVNIKCES